MVLPTGHKKWNWDQASQSWVVLALYRPLIFCPFLEFQHQKINWNRPNDLKHIHNFFISSLACKVRNVFLVSSILPKIDGRKNLTSLVIWIVFVHFLEELKTTKRHFEINRPLQRDETISEFSFFFSYTFCINYFCEK